MSSVQSRRLSVGMGVAVAGVVLMAAAGSAWAGPGYARAGWRARLSTLQHGVRGTVRIVDADTVRVDNFFYDGGGLDVRFCLGTSNSNAAFQSGLLIGPQLFGTPSSGGSLVIDLPAGTNLDGWNAISVWCVDVNVNFGSGTFRCPGDFNGSGQTSSQDIFDFLAMFFANNLAADFNASGAVSSQDIFDFLAAFFAPCP